MHIPLILLLLFGFVPSSGHQTVFFDDVGDNPSLLASMIPVFDSHKADVIYFVIPTRLDNGTAALLAGKKTGVHGYKHFCGEFRTSYANASIMLDKGLSDFHAANLTPLYFRPPCDQISPEAKKAVLDHNLTFISGAPDFIFSCKDCSVGGDIDRMHLLFGGNITFHQNAFLGPHNRLNRGKLAVMDSVLGYFDNRSSGP